MMSSSTLLSNYIHEYEQRQLQQLASSITSLCTEAPLQRKNFSSRSSMLKDEIKMAQSLLPSYADHGEASAFHMSVDELLVQNMGLNKIPQSSSAHHSRMNHLGVSSLDASLANSFSFSSNHSRSRFDVRDRIVASQWNEAEYVSSTGNTQQCFDTSLHDLIIRRSATARRKEEKLCKLCLARGSNPAIDDVDEEDSLSEASVDTYDIDSFNCYLETDSLADSDDINRKYRPRLDCETSKPRFERNCSVDSLEEASTNENRPIETLHSMLSTLHRWSLPRSDADHMTIDNDEGHHSLRRAMNHLAKLKKIIEK